MIYLIFLPLIIFLAFLLKYFFEFLLDITEQMVGYSIIDLRFVLVSVLAFIIVFSEW